MRLAKFSATIITALALSTPLAQAAISLNFGSLPGSTIQFNGAASSFTINPGVLPPGNQWQITSVSGGVGDSLGLQGNFVGGPWTYGPITTSGLEQTANVIGPLGMLTISDGSGGILSGIVNWVQVSTFQYTGGVNASAQVNISNLAYVPGGVPINDLQSLVLGAGGNGSVLLAFGFNPGKTLTDLTTGAGPYTTAYSGSITAVPEASSVFAGAMLLLPLAASTLRILRRTV